MKKPQNKQSPSFWTKIKAETKDLNPMNFIILTIAGIINAFGVTLFLFPVKLYDSGISGFGMKKQGFAFTAYSVFTVAVYSLMSFLIMDVLPIDVSFVSPLAGSDLLLCAIFGGVISGVGSGLTIRFGGAIDGIKTS